MTSFTDRFGSGDGGRGSPALSFRVVSYVELAPRAVRAEDEDVVGNIVLGTDKVGLHKVGPHKVGLPAFGRPFGRRPAFDAHQTCFHADPRTRLRKVTPGKGRSPRYRHAETTICSPVPVLQERNSAPSATALRKHAERAR